MFIFRSFLFIKYIFVLILVMTVTSMAQAAISSSRVLSLRDAKIQKSLQEQLFEAAKTGNVTAIRDILDTRLYVYKGHSTGLYVDLTDEQGQTALMVALSHNHRAAANVLLEAGADVNAPDGDRTVLMREVDHIENVKFLIEKGADIYLKNREGYTVLKFAARHETRETFDFLLEIGSRQLLKELLLKAVYDSDIEIIRFLLHTGIDINLRLERKKTALIVAAERGQEEVVQLLLEAGANVDLKDEIGDTALMRTRKVGIAQLLLEAKARVDLKNIFGYTALMNAADDRMSEVFDLLLEAGADARCLYALFQANWPLKSIEDPNYVTRYPGYPPF